MATDWRTVGSGNDGDRFSRLLSDERRRLVLAVLAETGAPVSLANLARLVARREVDRDGGRVDDRTDAVQISLYHKDVPKLDEADLVDWDRDQGVVRPGADLVDAIPLVEAIADAGDAPPRTGDLSEEPPDAGGYHSL